MKITINTDVLKKYCLTLREFLVMLIGYYGIDVEDNYNNLVKRGLLERNLFQSLPPILSDKSKNLVAKILTESDDRAVNSNIDFEALAKSLTVIYPDGRKPGTTYSWRGQLDEIEQKLRTLVVKYNFTFTEEEAINAVQEYVNSFKDFKYMQLLKYFILRTYDDGHGRKEIDSLFMSIIENNRENENNN